MELALSRQLSELTDALEDPGTDLQAILAVLIDDVTAVVPSFLGLRMTLQLAGEPVALTAIDPTAIWTARSSLQLPLDSLSGARPGSVVVFYARDANAFALLASDTRRAVGLDGQVLLDQHLPGRAATTAAPVVSDPAQAAVLHRAIGWLIDQGLPPDEATGELRRRATAAGRTLTAAAEYLLETGTPGHGLDPTA